MHETAFVAFYRSVHPRLVRYALRHGFGHDIAHELASDALRILWDQDREEPRDEEEHRGLSGLCFQIVDGLIRNTVRSAQRRSAMEARWRAVTRIGEVVPDVAEQVIDTLMPSWPVVLERLSEADRRVLLLLIEGYRAAEIAQLLGCSRGAVDTRLHRVRARLRALLAEGGRDDEAS